MSAAFSCMARGAKFTWQDGSPKRNGRGGGRASLADSASELSCNTLAGLALKGSDTSNPSKARLRLIRPTLCAPCANLIILRSRWA